MDFDNKLKIWQINSIIGWCLSLILILTILTSDNEEKQTFGKGIHSLSENLMEEIKKTKKKYVLIKDFQDFKNAQTPLGRFVVENLISCINEKDNSITFINRENAKDIINEINFQHSGITSAENSLRIGKIVGSQLMMSGRTEASNKEITVSVSITDIETNKIINSRTYDMLSNQIINTVTGYNKQFDQCVIVLLDKMKTVIANNFQWLWAAILVPIAGYVWNQKRKKREKETSNQEKNAT